MKPSSRVVLVAVALLLLAISPASAAHQAAMHRRPNLVVGAVDLTVTGRVISGTITVRNTGNAAARRSVTSIGGLLLSTPPLRPRHRATLPVATSLPASETKLLLCVDVRHRIREQHEGDNCQTYSVPPTHTTFPPPPASTTPLPSNPGVHASTGPVVE